MTDLWTSGAILIPDAKAPRVRYADDRPELLALIETHRQTLKGCLAMTPSGYALAGVPLAVASSGAPGGRIYLVPTYGHVIPGAPRGCVWPAREAADFLQALGEQVRTVGDILRAFASEPCRPH